MLRRQGRSLAQDIKQGGLGTDPYAADDSSDLKRVGESHGFPHREMKSDKEIQ